jgi:hypothetical protein
MLAIKWAVEEPGESATSCELDHPRRAISLALIAGVAHSFFVQRLVWQMERRLSAVCDQFRTLHDDQTGDDKEASELVRKARRICDNVATYFYEDD